MLTPKYRFKGFTDDLKEYKLKDILTRVSNPVDVKKDEKYKQIGIKSHGKGLFYKEEVTGKDLGNKRVFWIEPDCLIVNIVFAWERAVARTTSKEVGMIASHRFPMYKPNSDILDLDFIVKYLISPKGQQLMIMASPGGAGRNKTLGQSDFLNSIVKIPSLDEQIKIGKMLDQIDDLIKVLEDEIDCYKKEKISIMNKIFSGEIPTLKSYNEWNIKKLSELEEEKILELGRGRVIPKTSSPGEYPVYSSSKVNRGLMTYINQYDFDEELISWSIDGGGNLFYRNKHKFSITNVSGYIRLLNNNILNYKYLFYDLEYNHSNFIFDYLNKAHPSVIRDLYEIHIPPMSEQEIIVNYLQPYDEIIEKKQKKLDKWNELKEGLIQDIFI